MGGAGIVFFVVLALMAIGVWLLFGGLAVAGSVGYRQAPEESDADELRYVVPEGQDPAAVLVALKHHGYDARIHDSERERVVGVTCPQGKDHDRADVRAVISAAGTTVQDTASFGQDVRFRDE